MNKVIDVAAAIVVVAGIMVLVRPGSQGPQLADTIGKTFIGSLQAATGGGSWNG